MDEIDDDFLTLDEADLVDITEDALDAHDGETINLVPSLKSDGVLPDVYTIGADGKLVSVSHIQDFKKHHDTSSTVGGAADAGNFIYGGKGQVVHVNNLADFEKHRKESIAKIPNEAIKKYYNTKPVRGKDGKDGTGKLIFGGMGQVVQVNNMADFEKHHKEGIAHFRNEALKRGSAYIIEDESPSPQPPKRTIRNVSSSIHSNGENVQSGPRNVHVFSVPAVKKPARRQSQQKVPYNTVYPMEYVDLTGQASDEQEQVPLQALPVSSPITYLNGVPGQIVSGRQLQELQDILGYQPEIVTDASAMPPQVKPLISIAPQIPKRQAVILPATVTPILQKPLTSISGGPGFSSLPVGKKSGNSQQDVSQTIIAKNSATYQREKNYYFSQTSVLSPLIPPHMSKRKSEEATQEALHLNSKVSLMTDISDDWNMQGCITFGTATEGQVFAPRLLVPRSEGGVGRHAIVDGGGRKTTATTTTSQAPILQELLTYQGLYNVNGMDLIEDLFVRKDTRPADAIGVEQVYSSFEAVSGVGQKPGRIDKAEETDLIEEDIDDEKSDMEVEFDMGENNSGEKITLNLKKMIDSNDTDNMEVWTIKKEDDDSFVAAVEASTSDGTLVDKRGSLAAEATAAQVSDAPKKLFDAFEKYSGYACYLCLFASTDRESVLQHWLDCHKSAKPYLCPYCNQEFGVSCNVFNHIILHHSLESKKSFLFILSPIYKESLEVTFNDEGIASNVLIVDTTDSKVVTNGEFVFSCLGCPYASLTIAGIRRHLREVHYKILPYMCPYCGVRFVDCFEAKQHVCMYHEKWAIKVLSSMSGMKSIDDTVLNQRFDVTPLEAVEMSSPDEDLVGQYLWDVSSGPDGVLYSCKKCNCVSEDRFLMYDHVTMTHNCLHGVACPKCKFYNQLRRKCIQRGYSSCRRCLYFLNLNVGRTVEFDKNEESIPFYLCLECKYLDKGRGGMITHLKLMHLKCRPYSCAYCTYSHFEKPKVRSHIVWKHKGKPVHILKNRDLDNRAMDALLGMYKQIRIPKSLVAEIEKTRPNINWTENDETADAVPDSSIDQPDNISVSASRKKQKKKESRVEVPSVTSDKKRPARFNCKLCDHVCRDRYAMHRHVKSYHLNGKPYTCSCCRYGATFKYLVERHMKMCHPTSPQYVDTNYKMLHLLDEACKQYYRVLGKPTKEQERIDDEYDGDQDRCRDSLISIGQLRNVKVEPEEEDLEEMMVQEEDESYDEDEKDSLSYMPIGDLKRRILDLHPEFQLDPNLVNEPVVILKDIMRDILKCEKVEVW